MKTRIAFLGCMMAAVAQAGAIKKQVLAGVGYSMPHGAGSEARTTMAGGAIIVPITPRLFVRPFGIVGLSDPVTEGKPTGRFAQSGVLIGWKATGRFTVLAGGGETFVLSRGKPMLKLPTAIVSTGTRIGSHWGVFTPVSFHKNAVGGAVQLGYTR